MRNIQFWVVWIMCIIGLPSVPAWAASTRQLVAQGNALFSEGKYDDALQAYKEAEVNAPESPQLYFNKGTALYKQGDYAAATDAFQQAALKSQVPELEAESKFNLGLCAVREAERQQDSDLQKALDAYGRSIQSFREALDLKPDFREAAENIEVVRLMMKSILDEIKKREEEAKKQQEQAQQAVEQLKALIERQQDLIARNDTLAQAAQQTGQSDILKLQSLTNDQGVLQHDTQQLADTLANQAKTAQGAQGAEPEAVTHLRDSVQEQELAVQQLTQNQQQSAGEHQQKSLDALLKAQESFTKQQQQQQGQQQQQQGQQGQQQQDQQGQQQGQQQQQDQQDQQGQDQGQAGSEQDQQQQENQQVAVAQLPDNADSILDEEKQNNMRRTYNTGGGYSEVDKDW